MAKTMRKNWPIWSAIALLTFVSPFAARAEPTQGSSVIVFGGQMTDNDWQETFQPSKLEFLDSHFVGIGLGYDWVIGNSRWTLGVEGQVVGHFGRQDHLEFNLPVVARYHARRPYLPSFHSVAFGIGLSTTSKKPKIEIDRDGQTTNTLVYWMLDVEFDLPPPNTSLSFRLHHRSDAFGLFDTDSGSNALAVGIRRRF